VIGLTGVLIALIVLTIVLAGVFLVRSSITEGATGKILAFVGLCVLPVLCIGTGMSFHLQRSQQTRYCVSCHSMESHGKSLYVLNPKYIPAQHFQNHLVPSDKACYTCHTDYTMFGPLKDKLRGLMYVYMEYVSTPPKTIHLIGRYNNLQCLHCHAGTRDFEGNLEHMPPLASLESNQVSCISSGCHDMVHNVSEVDHLKMWTGGVALTSFASGSSSPAPAKAAPGATAGPSKAAAPQASGSSSRAPAKAKPRAAAGPSKARTGSSAGAATAARGKGIFDSQHCSGCHGKSGGGGSGPALTHISSQYPPAKLTALLEAPTAKMKAAGMVPLTLNAADMKALVSYVTSLGGTSAASAAAPPASGSSSSAPANAKPAATAGPSKAASTATTSASVSSSTVVIPLELHISISAATAPASGSSSPAPAKAKPGTTAGPSKAASPAAPPASGSSSPAPAKAKPSATAGPPMNKLESKGKLIFKAHGCADCHGTDGVAGTAAASALAGTGKTIAPALLTKTLKHPTARMQQGGMPPVSLSAEELKALVAYLSYISASKSNPH